MDFQNFDANQARYEQGHGRRSDFTAFAVATFVVYALGTPIGMWVLGAINAEQAGIVAAANIFTWIGCIWFSQWYVTHG